MIPDLHVVTDDEILGRRDFSSLAARVLREGRGDVALHLRGPGIGGRALFHLAETLQREACLTGSLVLANDRVDVALAADLSGAHLGQRSIPAGSARDLLGTEKILGLSVHSVDEAIEVDQKAVDFFLVGTIFSSLSHPGAKTGGVERIREVGCRTDVPLFAIGGITPGRVEAVLSAGARGVAVRGGIWDSRDPAEATRAYVTELKKGEG